MRKIICISGDLGSGKSTVGKIIARKIGYEYYSAGLAFRQLAEEKGINVLELNRMSEHDMSIDHMIDSKIEKMAEEKEMLILDSRMAWHFAKGGFNVYMAIDECEAARRVQEASRGSSECYNSFEDALTGLRSRREAEAQRYLSKYKEDICNMQNYHLVLDTTCMSPEDAANLIIEKYQKMIINE